MGYPNICPISYTIEEKMSHLISNYMYMSLSQYIFFLGMFKGMPWHFLNINITPPSLQHENPAWRTYHHGPAQTAAAASTGYGAGDATRGAGH